MGSTMNYEHTQKLPDNVLIAAGAASLAVGLTPPGMLMRLAVWGILGSTVAAFRSLTVKVDESELSFYFGDGLIRKSINLKEIISVQIIRTTILQGWGIHWLGNGWIYNVYGLDAIELSHENGKRTIVGSDDCENLAKAVRDRLLHRDHYDDMNK